MYVIYYTIIYIIHTNYFLDTGTHLQSLRLSNREYLKILLRLKATKFNLYSR